MTDRNSSSGCSWSCSADERRAERAEEDSANKSHEIAKLTEQLHQSILHRLSDGVGGVDAVGGVRTGMPYKSEASHRSTATVGTPANGRAWAALAGCGLVVDVLLAAEVLYSQHDPGEAASLARSAARSPQSPGGSKPAEHARPGWRPSRPSMKPTA